MRVSSERTRRLVPANRSCPAHVATSLAKGDRLSETMWGIWRTFLILHSAISESPGRPKSAPGSSILGTRSRGCHGLRRNLIRDPWKPICRYLASQVAFPLTRLVCLEGYSDVSALTHTVGPVTFGKCCNQVAYTMQIDVDKDAGL